MLSGQKPGTSGPPEPVAYAAQDQSQTNPPTLSPPVQAKPAVHQTNPASAGAPQTQEANTGGPQTKQANAGGPQTEQANAGGPETEQANAGRPQTKQANAGGPQSKQANAGGPQSKQANAGGPQSKQAMPTEPDMSNLVASSDDDCAEDPRKRHARMRAKVNRLCSRTSTGKLSVSEDLHRMWVEGGTLVQQDMIQVMSESEGHRATSLHLRLCASSCFLVSAGSSDESLLGSPSQADFVRNIETYKESKRYREQSTTGGYYSEEDMKKKVSEGGLGLNATLFLID